MKSDAFRLRWRVKSFGSSNAPLRGECLRVVLRFNIEEMVRREIEDRSPKEFGRVDLPRILRTALSKAMFSLPKLTVS
jgi:hypothetical protein